MKMRGRKRSGHLAWMWMFILLFIGSGWQTPVQAAGEPVELKVDVGFDGYYDWSSMVPISVTVTNVSGKAEEGDVILSMQNYSQFDGTYKSHVQLQKGESKKLTFRVHGQTISTGRNDSYVRWVQDDFAGVRQPVIGQGVPDEQRFVAVLGAENAAAAVLKAQPPLPKSGIPRFIVVAIQTDQLTPEMLMDSGIDTLMVTKEAEARLHEQARKEMGTWQKEGGEYIVVEPGGEAAAWAAVVKKANEPAVGHGDPFSHAYTLSEAASAMPSLTLPDVPLAALLFAGYIVIIGPLVFYVMKKRNAREWNWLVIPVLALSTTGAVYLYGSWQHGDQVKMQSASLVNLLGNGAASVEQANTFFVPHGGDYALSYPGQVDVVAMGERNGQTRKPDEYQIMVDVGPNRKEVQFRDAGFWSMHTVYARKWENDLGTINGVLEMRNNQITGTVRNNTKYTLKDVRIASGHGVQEVAKLAPGETVQVKLTATQRPLNGPFIQTEAGRRMMPAHMRTDNKDFSRSSEAKLIEMAYYPNVEPNEVPDVYVLGWVDAPALKTGMSEASYESTAMTLVKAKIATVKTATAKGGAN